MGPMTIGVGASGSVMGAPPAGVMTMGVGRVKVLPGAMICEGLTMIGAPFTIRVVGTAVGLMICPLTMTCVGPMMTGTVPNIVTFGSTVVGTKAGSGLDSGPGLLEPGPSEEPPGPAEEPPEPEPAPACDPEPDPPGKPSDPAPLDPDPGLPEDPPEDPPDPDPDPEPDPEPEEAPPEPEPDPDPLDAPLDPETEPPEEGAFEGNGL